MYICVLYYYDLGYEYLGCLLIFGFITNYLIILKTKDNFFLILDTPVYNTY